MDFGALRFHESGGEVVLSVHARPRSKRSRIEGVREGALDVAVHAAPQDGAANEEILEVIADALGVPKRSVRLVRGGASRQKVVAVSGITASELLTRLGAVS